MFQLQLFSLSTQLTLWITALTLLFKDSIQQPNIVGRIVAASSPQYNAVGASSTHAFYSLVQKIGFIDLVNSQASSIEVTLPNGKASSVSIYTESQIDFMLVGCFSGSSYLYKRETSTLTLQKSFNRVSDAFDVFKIKKVPKTNLALIGTSFYYVFRLDISSPSQTEFEIFPQMRRTEYTTNNTFSNVSDLDIIPDSIYFIQVNNNEQHVFLNDLTKLTAVSKVQDGTTVFDVVDYIDYNPAATQIAAAKFRSVVVINFRSGVKEKTFSSVQNSFVIRQLKGTPLILVGSSGKVYYIDYTRPAESSLTLLDQQGQFEIYDIEVVPGTNALLYKDQSSMIVYPISGVNTNTFCFKGCNSCSYNVLNGYCTGGCKVGYQASGNFCNIINDQLPYGYTSNLSGETFTGVRFKDREDKGVLNNRNNDLGAWLVRMDSFLVVVFGLCYFLVQ